MHSPPAQLRSTDIGEIRTDRLEDGSTVTLGAKSQIMVRFTQHTRAVVLNSGEAWFHVAHNRERPFVVSAGARSITAVGTAFVVQRRADNVVVTVTDGNVEVAPEGISGTTPPLLPIAVKPSASDGRTRLSRGQQISYADKDSPSTIEAANPQTATGWSKGQLEFDHVPLQSAVQVLNRYSAQTISVDHFSGEQIVTGLVLQNQISEWIHGLTAVYPVEVLVSGMKLCVRARDSGLRDDTLSCD